ncbi:MAG: TonB-dependent receptor [Acidobacteriota bacterium]|nr:TonB-dependent receptor [Acidobacteriota bacterium]
MLFAILTLLSQSPAPATPMHERIVVTATAAPAAERTLGRAVTFITRDEIERFAGGSIADALRLAPGLDVRARGEQGVQADFVVRGAAFGQTLVMIDGLRINDAQSGHHNADFTLSLASIDRIEVVSGAASSVHGADAFGGTINIVSRAGVYKEASVAAGSWNAVRGEAAFGRAGGVSASAWGSRSSGFMFDRGYGLGGARVSAGVGGVRGSVAHARKAFGANGFYGPSPSKEWTDATLAAAGLSRVAGGWAIDARGAYRNHGDRFRWDIARPGFAENVHRTNAVDGTMAASRDFRGGRRVTLGAAGGGDWIESSNLGTRTLGRGGVFAQMSLPLGTRAVVRPALRADAYSTWGSALSPSLSIAAWSGSRWRLRASTGRAFRVPTYTERFYTDPNHAARDGLLPERGWTLDAGADWRSAAWSVSGTLFGRWDANVIDWVRASTQERWQTTNVHDVETIGVEWSGRRAIGGGFAGASYAWLRSEAPALRLLSKYVLDYTRHAVGAHAALPLPAKFDLSARADRRIRSDGQRYTLVNARIARRAGHATIFVEGANLLDERYTEIAGVAMAGRSLSAGLTVR